MLMPQKEVISSADKALADFIWKAIENEPAAKNLVSTPEQIVFSAPNKTRRPEDKLSIFLFNVMVGKAAEIVGDLTGDGAEVVELHYLVTPLVKYDGDAHALLDAVIHAISASPLATSAEEKSAVFNVRLDSLSLAELSGLWTALGTTLRASICLTAASTETKIIYEPQHATPAAASFPAANPAPVRTGNAAQLYQFMFKTFTEQSEGWKKRNMFVRQWVMQDFRKNTKMSVEEMRSELLTLGERIERGGSTAQFVKPLNLLAKFYEHQLAEMQGMQKVSHRQHEDIEMITSWIANVKSLAQAISN